jgi:hypothetical protein
MNLDIIDVRTLMGMLFHSMDCYIKLLKKGIYTGKKFEKCRVEMLEIGMALHYAMKRRTSLCYRSVVTN